MTQEDKELLLKDLCGRLPYGVKCIEKTPIEDFQDKNLWEIDRIRYDTNMFGMSNCYVCYGQYDDIDNIKPYLFPLSSMTKEQEKEESSFDPFVADEVKTLGDWAVRLVDFYNKHHFDHHGLIEKGIALDATGLNIY